MHTFQDLVLRLSQFWASEGCVLQQPYDMEVGAGTMHPETFLRVLGPEPWRVAYVQPSRRPADGRYGDNPFRLGKHHQFQVILKPSPPDIQRLYIRSLEAMGIDLTGPRPALRGRQLGGADARRLGRRLAGDARRHGDHAVHLFPAGGRPRARADLGRDYLRPRAHHHVPRARATASTDIAWAEGVEYGQVRHQDEYEMSKYYFEIADVAFPAADLRRHGARGPALPGGRARAAGLRVRPQMLARSSTCSTRAARFR